MVSKTLPSLKSILELLLSSLRSTWLLFTDFLGSVSCNSSSLHSQKSRVLLSSRCLIFKVLRSRVWFVFSVPLSSAWLFYHTQVRLSSTFFKFFSRPFSFTGQVPIFGLFTRFQCPLSRALMYYTATIRKCQRFFPTFFIFLSIHHILCLHLCFYTRFSYFPRRFLCFLPALARFSRGCTLSFLGNRIA